MSASPWVRHTDGSDHRAFGSFHVKMTYVLTVPTGEQFRMIVTLPSGREYDTSRT